MTQFHSKEVAGDGLTENLFLGTATADDVDSGGADDTIYGYAGNDILCGGAGKDTLYGGDGNDMLDGGAGADTMAGGAGSDMYYVDNIHDKVIEDADPGQDTVHTTVSYTLTANVEYLVLDGAGGAINGTGNALNNVITGNASANVLNGMDGDDLLHGGLGDDTLLGGKGDDTLDGGAGIDKLTGGAGADTFLFRAADAGADTITDFSAKSGDLLDIRDVLTGYDGGSLEDWVHVTASGRNTVISVDADGAANGASFTVVATLSNVSAASLGDADTMAAQGVLLAA